MEATKHPAEDIFHNRSLDRKHCFLCGTKLGAKNTTREHIFPKFVLREFNLWKQQLTLINGTKIPYRKVVIPCCRECNNDHIGRLDNRIATFLRGGFDTFKKTDEPSVFQWLSRILYSLLYLELVTPRDPRFKRRKILRRDFFKTLRTVHLFLSSVRSPTKFHRPYPWSLLILKTQKCANRILNFDFKDNPLLLTAAVRMNDVGIVGVLQDNGSVGMLGKRSVGIAAARKLTLHPIQFSEIAARAFYLASLLTRVPKCITVFSGDGKMEVVPLPIGGFSLKPIFAPWVLQDYARALSWSCHLPYEQVYYPDKGVMTFLHDDNGTPKHIPFDGSAVIIGDRGLAIAQR